MYFISFLFSGVFVIVFQISLLFINRVGLKAFESLGLDWESDLRWEENKQNTFYS